MVVVVVVDVVGREKSSSTFVTSTVSVLLDGLTKYAYCWPMNKKKTFWGHVRVLLVELLVGLALGVGVWELIGRRILALKYGSLGSSVTCATDVERALTEFDTGLRLSAVIGAVLFLVLTLVIRFML